MAGAGVRFDPKKRGSPWWDDKVWGSTQTVQQVAVPGGGPVSLKTNGTLVQFDMWPPRLVALVGIVLPASLPAWTADGQTYAGLWTVNVGLGRTNISIPIPFVWAPPYAPVYLGGGPATPFLAPAKQVTLQVSLAGTSVATGTLGLRFVGMAAPYSLGGLGLEEEGGSAG